MTIAYWCVFAAALLPYATVAIAKRGSFDNSHPRDWEARLEGRRKRAHHAHLNGFEAFPFFAAMVILAHLLHAPQGVVDVVAILFVAARVVYVWCYIVDKAMWRSLAWGVGFACCVALFFIAAFARGPAPIIF